MELTENILVQAIVVDEEIIPFWDKRFKAYEDEDYGLLVNSQRTEVITANFNCISKILSRGVIVDDYSTKFAFGDKVLYITEPSYFDCRKLKNGVITKITFRSPRIDSYLGPDVPKHLKRKFPEIDFSKNILYSIRNWITVYTINESLIVSESNIYTLED